RVYDVVRGNIALEVAGECTVLTSLFGLFFYAGTDFAKVSTAQFHPVANLSFCWLSFRQGLRSFATTYSTLLFLLSSFGLLFTTLSFYKFLLTSLFFK